MQTSVSLSWQTLGVGEFLREAPDLAAAGDRRVVVEIHRMHVAAFLHRAVLGLEAHRDHLAGLGIVAETGRIRHADEFVVDRVADHLERFRNNGAQNRRDRFDS